MVAKSSQPPNIKVVQRWVSYNLWTHNLEIFLKIATQVRLKKITKIMENEFEQWHPSSRCYKDASFSVSQITIFFSGRGVKEKKQENHTAHWTIWNLFLFFFLLLQRTSLNNKQTFYSFTRIPNQEMNFLKLCRLFWVILLHYMSNFSETGRTPVPVEAPSPRPVHPWISSPEQLPSRLPHQQPPAHPSAPLLKLCSPSSFLATHQLAHNFYIVNRSVRKERWCI